MFQMLSSHYFYLKHPIRVIRITPYNYTHAIITKRKVASIKRGTLKHIFLGYFLYKNSQMAHSTCPKSALLYFELTYIYHFS